jgi:hypothetical protein
MKKATDQNSMCPEYDFSKGIRGKYAKRYAEGTNIVMIDPDVHVYFPDQKSVNDALRRLAAIIRQRKKVEPVDKFV